MLQTILTALDGSDHARMASSFAIELAARHDADLILLQVQEGVGPEPDAPATGLLEAAAKEARTKGVNRIETLAEEGDPAERILSHAKDKSADLIVMGSRGLGKMTGLVLGSVSHKVMQLAPCSCVTLRHGEGGAGLEDMKSILVPTDGSDHARKAVNLASEIASRNGAVVHLLYAMWRGPTLAQLRASVDLEGLSQALRDELDPALHPAAEHLASTFIPPVVSKEGLTEIGESVLAQAKRAAEAKGAKEIQTLLRGSDDPARSIAAASEHVGADLVVMGCRGLTGIGQFVTGSISYKVNHSVACSCMTVR